MSGKSSKLKLPVEFCGKSAAEHYPRMQELLQGSANVYVDAESTEDMDTTGLQMLLHFKYALEAQGRSLSWSKFKPYCIEQMSLGGFAKPLAIE